MTDHVTQFAVFGNRLRWARRALRERRERKDAELAAWIRKARADGRCTCWGGGFEGPPELDPECAEHGD